MPSALRNSPVGPFAAGFAAITIALILGYYAPTFTWPKFDFNILHGIIFLGFPPDPTVPLEQLPPEEFRFSLFQLAVVGAFFNYVLFGVFLAYFYVHVLHPLLPGESSGWNNVLKGLTFSLLLIILFEGIVFSKLFDVGFYFSNVKESLVVPFYSPGNLQPWEWSVDSLLFFGSYGLTLGLLYRPSPKEET